MSMSKRRESPQEELWVQTQALPQASGLGQARQRLRAEYTERSFAHLYETGGMRRTHLWVRRIYPSDCVFMVVHSILVC